MKKNIVIVSHCRDEIVYFYDMISQNSIVVLITKPNTQNEYNIFNNFIIDTGCRCIQLDEIDTFNMSFTLSLKTQGIISDLLSYNIPVITQVRATIESDIVSRKVYDYIDSLHYEQHYVPVFDLTNTQKKRTILPTIYNYLKSYSNNDSENFKMLLNTFNAVSGIKKV